ncbi:MAG: HDOD domain-containing protein [Bdellovibrionales bacterium]|nr:HDOD domain-containing protein [Bdellovibrionales bacterium]
MADQNDTHEAEGNEKGHNPLILQLPCDPAVLNEARRLMSEENSRVDALGTTCLQDPIIVIELLKTSNALYFSSGKSAITSPKTAIVRLGSDVVTDTFNNLTTRQQLTDPGQLKWYSINRSRSKRIGIVSRIFAEAIARPLAEDCQAVGCMFSIGDMLAVYYLGQDYVDLAEEHSRSGVNYRLTSNLKFDVDQMCVAYLRRNGIPESLLFAIDREAKPRTQDRVVMKPLCMAASELVDAFDSNKWEKFAPGKNVPPKSALRMLKMTDSQYLKIYERTSEYLFSARMQEERQRREPIPEIETPGSSQEVNRETQALESEIQNILSGSSAADELVLDSFTADDAVLPDSTRVEEISEDLSSFEAQFSLASAKSEKKTVARVQEPVKAVEPPKLRTKKGNKFVSAVNELFEEAESSEELLAGLLQKLTDGPFEKAALIVVSRDRNNAIVVAARGSITNGQKLELNDPLSPLARCFSKVQSFSSRPNEASPWGSKAFALAPIDADHDTPVALYADCGTNGSLTFEARRIFRTVVEILNQKLPSIPGGIPVELGEAPTS